ncbi:hypothetical protein D043_4057B, partial [Vibrio parahaemolyticus EKP-021]
SALLAVRS